MENYGNLVVIPRDMKIGDIICPEDYKNNNFLEYPCSARVIKKTSEFVFVDRCSFKENGCCVHDEIKIKTNSDNEFNKYIVIYREN